MKAIVIIPTYNERENIVKLIPRVLGLGLDLEILVVDDNSPDGTARLVEKLAQEFPKVHLLERQKKLGLGSAYIAGFKWALARDYEAVLEMDADFSHCPRYVQKFLNLIQNFDVIVGSRWMKGGKVINWALWRFFLSRLANIYTQWVMGPQVHDWTGGFTCYRRRFLESLDLDAVRSDGYGFQIEMKYLAVKNGFSLMEFPIQFANRTVGDSKISRHIVFEAFFLVWILRFKHLFAANKPKKKESSEIPEQIKEPTSLNV